MAHADAAAEQAFLDGNYAAIPEKLRDEFARRVQVSTAPCIFGREIASNVDIVTAECVFGLSLFKDMFTAATDIFGGRSNTAQKAFREAREVCLTELRKEALAAGANAVVSIDLDYSEISGGGKSMLFLVASGTAVRLKP